MRDVTDELGRKIQIPQNIHRVVSLAPSITETLYALGVQDRLVGDSDYCDYPPEAKQKQLEMQMGVSPQKGKK